MAEGSSAVKDRPPAAVRWGTLYSRAESMESARKAFDAVNETSEAVTESVGRLQASTQQAGTKIEQALTSAASRMKDAA